MTTNVDVEKASKGHTNLLFLEKALVIQESGSLSMLDDLFITELQSEYEDGGRKVLENMSKKDTDRLRKIVANFNKK